MPVLGFCLGHEIIAVAFGGSVAEMPRDQRKKQKAEIRIDDVIFEGLGEAFTIEKKHMYHVPSPPQDFEVLAYSRPCPVEVMKHKSKPIYGFQRHPEASGEEGYVIINNFLKICGVQEYSKK